MGVVEFGNSGWRLDLKIFVNLKAMASKKKELKEETIYEIEKAQERKIYNSPVFKLVGTKRPRAKVVVAKKGGI